MNRKISAFYPMTNEFYSISAYSHLIREFDVKYFICPSNLTSTKSSIEVYETLPATEEIEQLIVGKDSSFLLDFDLFYFPIIKSAIDRGIDICFVSEFSQEELQQVLLYNVDCNKKVEISTLSNTYPYIDSPTPRIASLKTPVVFIASSLERCRKFEVELALYEEFSRKGYKPTLVASKEFAPLFDVYSFPKFVFSRNLETDKIVNLNMFFKSIEQRDKPDIIFVGIPGAIAPFNNKILNYFGYALHATTNAVLPDVLVLNVNYDQFDLKTLHQFVNNCSRLTGVKPDALCFSDTQIDPVTIQENWLNYFYVEADKVLQLTQKVKNADLPVYYALDKNSLSKLADFIEKKLAVGDFSSI